MSTRALLLAYDFPPLVSVGALRPYSWYRYWREFGVSPVVVTRQWTNSEGYELDYVAPSRSPEEVCEETDYGTIIRTPYRPNLSNRLLREYGPERFRFLRRAVTGWYELSQYYWDIGPRQGLYAAARRYLREHGADAIVASGEPFVLFRYAAALSREFGIPWIADYRDPWSHNRARRGKRISERWEARLEDRFTSSADAITTTSTFFRSVISSLIRDKPFHVIGNGYDPEAVAAAAHERQSRETLTLAYVGSIYPFYPLESFFRVCEEFIREREAPRFELLVVGVGDQAAVEKLLRRLPNLARLTTFHGRLPNDETARVVARANAFVLFNNYAYPGTKVFDYLALRRRVLLCYSADPEALALKARYYNMDVFDTGDSRVLESLIEETGAGTVVRDAGHLREVLANLYDELLEHGQISCQSQDVERFSRRAQAGRMAELVKDVAAR